MKVKKFCAAKVSGLLVLSALVLWVSSLAAAESAAESADDTRFQLFYENPIAVYGSEVKYDVFRDKKKIGQHILVFDKGGDTLLVSSKSELVVRYLGVPVYRYGYTAKEIWIDGKLASVESEIRDNRKKPRVIKAEIRGRALEVTDGGKSRLAPIVEYASTHWHPAALGASRVFHTTHGRVRNINTAKLGLDRIALRDADGNTRAVDATQYKITGGFAADLWYDKNNRWVKLRFKADDGSEINYSCVSCSAY